MFCRVFDLFKNICIETPALRRLHSFKFSRPNYFSKLFEILIYLTSLQVKRSNRSGVTSPFFSTLASASLCPNFLNACKGVTMRQFSQGVQERHYAQFFQRLQWASLCPNFLNACKGVTMPNFITLVRASLGPIWDKRRIGK